MAWICEELKLAVGPWAMAVPRKKSATEMAARRSIISATHVLSSGRRREEKEGCSRFE